MVSMSLSQQTRPGHATLVPKPGATAVVLYRVLLRFGCTYEVGAHARPTMPIGEGASPMLHNEEGVVEWQYERRVGLMSNECRPYRPSASALVPMIGRTGTSYRINTYLAMIRTINRIHRFIASQDMQLAGQPCQTTYISCLDRKEGLFSRRRSWPSLRNGILACITCLARFLAKPPT